MLQEGRGGGKMAPTFLPTSTAGKMAAVKAASCLFTLLQEDTAELSFLMEGLKEGTGTLLAAHEAKDSPWGRP